MLLVIYPPKVAISELGHFLKITKSLLIRKKNYLTICQKLFWENTLCIIRQHRTAKHKRLENFHFSNHPTTALNLSTSFCAPKF